jgi:hypothetical protein
MSIGDATLLLYFLEHARMIQGALKGLLVSPSGRYP